MTITNRNMSRWRKIARPIIATCLWDHRGEPEKMIRKALREAYPFGEREYHPYKIWLDEIRLQRGLKPTSLRKSKTVLPNPDQQEMFGSVKVI